MSQMGAILLHDNSETCVQSYVSNNESTTQLLLDSSVGGAIGGLLFVCFVALRPKSTAMVIAGRSVHLTTFFSWAGLNKRLTSNSCTYFRL